jgi:hypothetical protein
MDADPEPVDITDTWTSEGIRSTSSITYDLTANVAETDGLVEGSGMWTIHRFFPGMGTFSEELEVDVTGMRSGEDLSLHFYPTTIPDSIRFIGQIKSRLRLEGHTFLNNQVGGSPAVFLRDDPQP